MAEAAPGGGAGGGGGGNSCAQAEPGGSAASSTPGILSQLQAGTRATGAAASSTPGMRATAATASSDEDEPEVGSPPWEFVFPGGSWDEMVMDPTRLPAAGQARSRGNGKGRRDAP